jgi:hypothetical protein
MMEINWQALIAAVGAYYGLSMFYLFVCRRMLKPTKYGAAFYGGLWAESIALTTGTAGIVLTLAHVALGEALLATGMLGFCYVVVTSLVPIGGSVSQPTRERVIVAGYRLLGILSTTVIMYTY